ncbi:MAG: TetR/AcrR family transcriptional regulator [Coriobacteriia bacterium]
MSRDPRSGDAARTRILDAAASLFAERGFDGVSVGEIAERAQVSPANVFYHFTNKQTVYDRVVERSRDLLGAAFRAIEGTGSPRDRIEAVVSDYTRLVFEHPEAMRLLVEHIRRSAKSSRDVLLQAAGRVIRGLAAVIAEGVESGDFSPVDPAMAAEILFGMMNVRAASMVLESPGGVDETDPEAVAAFVSALFFEGVCSC